MSERYTSSIIFKYGDTDRVKQDVKTLNEIYGRQGSSLFIDVMAEQIGQHVLKFELNAIESNRILESVLNDLKEALLERT